MQNLLRDPLDLADAGRVWLSPLSFEAAFRQGLHVLEGHVLYDNQPMLDLLRTSGHPVQVRCDGGDVLSVELDVGQPALACSGDRTGITTLRTPKTEHASLGAASASEA